MVGAEANGAARNGAEQQPHQHVPGRPRVVALVEACEALRELGNMHCTLRLLAKLSPTISGLHVHHVCLLDFSAQIHCLRQTQTSSGLADGRASVTGRHWRLVS